MLPRFSTPSTGCFADCAQNEERGNSFDHFDGHHGHGLIMAWNKIGDQHPYSLNRGVNWRACHHETKSFGCTTGKTYAFLTHGDPESAHLAPVSGSFFGT